MFCFSSNLGFLNPQTTMSSGQAYLVQFSYMYVWLSFISFPHKKFLLILSIFLFLTIGGDMKIET